MSWRVESYQDAHGRVPVKDTLTSLAATDQTRVLRVISLLRDYGLALKMPHPRHLQGKLSELRMDSRPNSYRIIYAAVTHGKFLPECICLPRRVRQHRRGKSLPRNGAWPNMNIGQVMSKVKTPKREFVLVRQLIDLRQQHGLSQRQLAQRAGMQQPVIARLEGGRPASLGTLRRVAEALGAQLEVCLVPQTSAEKSALAPRTKQDAGGK